MKPSRITALEADINRLWNRLHAIPLPPPDERREMETEYHAKMEEWKALLATRARIQNPANPNVHPL